MPAARIRHSPILPAAVLVLGSEILFTTSGAAVKAVSQSLTTEMIVFGRNLLGLLLLLPLIMGSGAGILRTRIPHLHFLRAAVGVTAMYCFFLALGNLPLADAILLKLTAPVFIPLVAWLWLRERPSSWPLLAVPVGFLGVILVIEPGAQMNWFTLVGLGAGLFGALAKVSVRRLTRSEPTLRIIFYFGLYTTLLSSIPLLWGWQLPDLDQFLWLLVIAGCTTLGQFLLTRGYARAPAARLGPLTYVGVIFAGAYGYLFWGETPDLKFLAGAILVAAAGLLAVRSGNAAWSLRAS